MSIDQPYELVSYGKPTGVVELPVCWILDDAPYLMLPGGIQPSPRIAFQIYQDEFDQAYKEGTLFILTMHPMITGHRANMRYLDKLVEYMKSRTGVRFAIGRQVSEYVMPQEPLSPH
jgi:hypothetical protein